MNILQYDRKMPWYIALSILAVFTIAIFADVLFFFDNLILSDITTDIFEQFFYWRDFGFSQLKNGNLALWNPHLFSGVPFFGGFQSALLYPPNILYVILPVDKAINISIALHVLLIGFFMYLWASFRKLHSFACLCSSIILMFSGSYFLHIYAGHLSNLCTIAWVPLLFLCIDRLFDQRSLKWSLISIFTITMLILAGHPQYVYYTALAVCIYSALCLIKANHRTSVIVSLAVICTGSLLLSAVQILSGIAASSESVRSIGLPYSFAARFSFSPENIMTLLVPNFFGDMVHMNYWGRWHLFEMSLFIGITGLALAIYGAFYGERQTRRFSLTMVIILFVLALGSYTPLFYILYNWLPGFNNFRGASKFISLLTVFLVMLSGIGLDNLIRNKRDNIAACFVLMVAGTILLALSLWLSLPPIPPDFWQQILNYLAATEDSFAQPGFYSDPVAIKASARFTATALMHSAWICSLLALLFFAVKYHRLFACFIAILAVVEIFIFANASKQSFDANMLKKSEIETILRENPGDYRILNSVSPDSAMSIGAYDIWGDDSGVPLRYAQFLNFTQQLNPNDASQDLDIQIPHRLFSMIRCRYLFTWQQGKIAVIERKDIMNHIHLVSHWRIIDKRDDIFKEMEKPTFDPRQTVILETLPNIKQMQGENIGECKIEDSSSNYLTIKGKLAQPAILLITDNYSKGWKAKPLSDSSQQTYAVMPANYTLMAIPLSAGEHHLRLEYRPTAFVVGKWISLSSLIIYLLLILIAVRKSKILPNNMPKYLKKEGGNCK
jgi:hypothetical protein